MPQRAPVRPSTRGPLTAAAKEQVKAMAEHGVSPSDIAAEFGRSVQAILNVLGVKFEGAKLKARRGKAEKPKVARNQGGTRQAAVTPKKNPTPERTVTRVTPVQHSEPSLIPASGSPRGGRLLNHKFWLRAGISVDLRLPVDLQAEEAERLAQVVRSLPFSI